MWDFLTVVFNKVFSSPAQLVMFIILLVIVAILLKYTGLTYEPKKGFFFKIASRRRSDDSINELKLECLMLLFYSNAPYIVRMKAGLEYIHQGGNGPVLADVRTFAAKYTVEYSHVTATNKHLCLPGE